MPRNYLDTVWERTNRPFLAARRATHTTTQTAGLSPTEPAVFRVTLPARFYWDHRDRDLPAGDVERDGTRTVRVVVDLDTLREIRDDASYYATKDGPWVDQSLRRSAERTVETIDRWIAAEIMGQGQGQGKDAGQ